MWSDTQNRWAQSSTYRPISSRSSTVARSPQDIGRVEHRPSRPEGLIRGKFEWLGVDADFKPSTLHQLVGFPSPERPDTADGDIEKGMPEDTREELRLLFREDIDELQEMTGRDLGHWL